MTRPTNSLHQTATYMRVYTYTLAEADFTQVHRKLDAPNAQPSDPWSDRNHQLPTMDP
jgi:hypothetical protein